MYHIFRRRSLVVMLLLAGAAFSSAAQPDRPWSVTLQGGTAFGQGTFRSITEDQIHWGYQGGLSVGYSFGRFFSLEVGGQYAFTNQYALDCCPYWLSADGQRYFAPLPDGDGWYYSQLRTDTQWGKAYLQANLDLLSLVTRPTSRWSLTVSPQVSAVTTQTRRVAPTLISPSGQATENNYLNPRQWHLGYGGQASLGFQFSKTVGAALYGGITCLTGERFDNIPVHAHKSNLVWDAGLKLSFRFGGAGKRARAAALAAAEEAARLAAERDAAEQIARAAAVKEAAFQTPIPTVYFAHNSSSIEDAYASTLELALPILEQYPDFQLEIHAYASNSGTEAYNYELSEMRMEAVRQWYIAQGVAPERIVKAFYHGIDHNAPDAQSARRAEIKFAK